MEAAILSLNCAKCKQSGSKFASLVAEALPETAPTFFVVGLQEVAPILEASFKTLDEYLEPIRRAIVSTLGKKYDDKPFGLVADSWSGAIGVMVYAQRSGSIHGVKTSATTFGRFWSSLKAAAAVRLETENTIFTFVTTHLAANEGFAASRNRDYAILANGLEFGGEPLYVSSHNHQLFVFGDLNYRSLRPQSADASNEATGLLRTGYDASIDELAIEKRAGRTLWGLNEAPIEFPPTFKYFLGTSEYNTKRIPSWCDRILYSDLDATVQQYSSLPGYSGSDHKPVYLHIKLSPSAPMDVQVPPATFVGTSVSDTADRIVGSALFLVTTRIGWLCLALLILLFLFAIT